MYRAAWKSLLNRRARLVLSTLSVVLGVAFVAGSFIFTHMLSSVFDGITRGTVADVNVNPVGTYTSDASAALGGNTSASQAPLLSAGDLARFRGVEGVKSATGTIIVTGVYPLAATGKIIGTVGAPGIASNWFTDPAYGGQPGIVLRSGRAPASDSEVVIDPASLSKSGRSLGQAIKLALPDGDVVTRTVVGTGSWGGGGTVGATYVFFTTAEAQRLLLDAEPRFTGAWITAEPGTDIPSLVQRIQRDVPAHFEAVGGVAAAANTASQINRGLSFINTFLLVFAAIALLVASFLIVNTFSIIVAQRGRELALFRAMGASRRQVTNTVLMEAAVIGVAGSTAGLLGGWLLAWAIRALFRGLGIDLGAAPPGLTVEAVVAAYAVGMIVTMVAAWLPARRAGRVPPVAAMSGEAFSSPTGLGARAVVGIGLTVLGAAGMAVGLWAHIPKHTLVIGIGAALVLLGVAGASPLIGRPVVAGVGLGYRRMFHEVGRLAQLNAVRQPRRTAATASALMLSLALVTTLSVLGSSASASIHSVIDGSLRGDFTVQSITTGTLPAKLSGELSQVHGVARVDALYITAVGMAGSDPGATTTSAAGDTAMMTVMDVDSFDRIIQQTLVSGSLDRATGTVLVEQREAERRGLHVGDSLPVIVPATRTPVELTVSGIYSVPQGVSVGGFSVNLATGRELGAGDTPYELVVTMAPGADEAAVRSALDDATASMPTVVVMDSQQYAQQASGQVDQLLNMIYALLGLAIVIAVLGIVNTLALSVIERTREIGLLRAIGLTRAQLRLMITLESVIIALLGAVLGVVLGVAFGASLQHDLSGSGLNRLVIPWVQLVLYLVAAVVVGVVAAVWPARRAARLDVLQAIATE